jgi:hypothetical protein
MTKPKPQPRLITLDSCPADAPGAIKILSQDGRDLLVQSDWEFPGVAQTFGWSMVSVQAPGRGYGADYYRPACEHRHTDGTVDCPDCGISAGAFIASANTWLDEHDGAQVEDPGYFETDASSPDMSL